MPFPFPKIEGMISIRITLFLQILFQQITGTFCRDQVLISFAVSQKVIVEQRRNLLCSHISNKSHVVGIAVCSGYHLINYSECYPNVLVKITAQIIEKRDIQKSRFLEWIEGVLMYSIDDTKTLRKKIIDKISSYFLEILQVPSKHLKHTTLLLGRHGVEISTTAEDHTANTGFVQVLMLLVTC